MRPFSRPGANRDADHLVQLKHRKGVIMKARSKPRGKLKTAAEFEGALEQMYRLEAGFPISCTKSAFRRLTTRQQASVIQGKRCLAITSKKVSEDTGTKCLRGVRKLLGEVGLPGFEAVEIAVSASMLHGEGIELERHLLVGSHGMTERFAAELEKLIRRFGGGSVYDLAYRAAPRAASRGTQSERGSYGDVAAEFAAMMKSARRGQDAKRGRVRGKPRPKADRRR